MTVQRNTRQRDKILEVLETAEGPLTTLGILERARVDLPQLGLATVYRTVALLQHDGRISPVRLPGEEPRFAAGVLDAATMPDSANAATRSGSASARRNPPAAASTAAGGVRPGMKTPNHSRTIRFA